jgi:hypothetical protein
MTKDAIETSMQNKPDVLIIYPLVQNDIIYNAAKNRDEVDSLICATRKLEEKEEYTHVLYRLDYLKERLAKLMTLNTWPKFFPFGKKYVVQEMPFGAMLGNEVYTGSISSYSSIL